MLVCTHFILLFIIMARHWKNYKKVKSLVDSSKVYDLDEALELLQKTSYTKFDPSVEIAVKTNANPRYNDQNLRWTVVLPHWTGKKVKIAVYTTEDKVEEVKKMWVDVVGWEDLIKKIEKGEIDFDVLITQPDLIRNLAKVAKILWPKWLMPSPKAWTVTTNIKDTIEEIKKWRVEFKLDKTWNVHALVGKLSFWPEKLKENIKTLIDTLRQNKPSWVKWKLIKKIVISTTMGPWIQVNL